MHSDQSILFQPCQVGKYTFEKPVCPVGDGRRPRRKRWHSRGHISDLRRRLAAGGVGLINTGQACMFILTGNARPRKPGRSDRHLLRLTRLARALQTQRRARSGANQSRCLPAGGIDGPPRLSDVIDRFVAGRGARSAPASTASSFTPRMGICSAGS